MHLGPLDESVVRPQDLYLCIRPGPPPRGPPEFCIAWYGTQAGRVTFRSLDPNEINGASLGPLSLEAMLAEELPQLLQTLLVGVERVICRLPLDDLSFPPLTTAAILNNDTHESLARNASVTYATANISKSTIDIDDEEHDHTEVGSQRRPIESGLKRRELITKNKMMGNKYALLRAIKSENTGQPGATSPSQGELSPMEALAAADGSGAGMCLGGGLAFPHIDSDEESADEAGKRNGSGKGTNFNFFTDLQFLFAPSPCPRFR